MEPYLDTAPCGLLSFIDSGEIIVANGTACEMLGYRPGELVGAHFDQVLAPGARIFHQTHFFPLLKLQGKAEEIYFSLRSKVGQEVPVLSNAVRRTRNGIEVNDCVFLRIQQRRRFEEEILLARREANRASKAKDEFLAALSHELRTPLTPVLMTAVAMESDPSLSAEVRQEIAMIRRNVELEVRLIDDLLDITRISHGKLHLDAVETDVHTLLGHTHEIVLVDAARKNVDLSFSLQATAHHVRGDPVRLQQVFWNLVKNAVKFTPAGGRIEVTTGNPLPNRLAVGVSDTGLGIEAEALPRIFDAFEQGSLGGQPRFGGLGLGLAITRAIVERHSGLVSVSSEGLGCGATFTVELATVSAPPELTREAPAPPDSLRTFRLLIVEDHQATRDVLARILRRAGHEVHAAGDATEALAFAAAHPFDVVISDLGLPDMSGLDLMRKLKAQYKMGGIALSGYGTEEDVARARAAGFSAHLLKPISFERLQELLQGIPLPAK